MLEPGQIIQGKYRIVRLIGQGGMGEVYEGENVSIARRVAIKVLIGEAAQNADIVQRFEREAQAAGRIGNDHILEVLDLGALPNGERFMVMEFLDGEPLNSRIERLKQLSPEQVIPLLLQALAGLAAAHRAGIIHRDLKPENLFVLKQKAGITDYVKIIDFGISKFNQLSNEGMKMTKTGSVMGTPYYMSPEQANGSREADSRSDLYAMGVILYECVTGAVPFDGKTFNELLFKIVLSEAPRPRELVPHLDPAFEAIIRKGMAREIANRYQSCEEFSQALRDYQAGRGLPIAEVTGALPALDAASAVAVRGATGPALGTGVNWSNTGAGWPKRSKAPLFAGLAGAAVLILGVGAFAAYRASQGGPAAAAPSASASARSREAVVVPAAPKPELSAVPPAAEPEPKAAPVASAKAATSKPELAPAVSAARVAAPKNRPAPLPVTPKAVVAAKKKSAGSPTDFGY